MTTILQKIISEIKSSDKLDILRKLCDDIQKEESQNIVHHTRLPKGPNIFLSLEVPGKTEKEIGFIHLEREFENSYLIVFSTLLKSEIPNKNKGVRIQRTINVQDNRPEKILT